MEDFLQQRLAALIRDDPWRMGVLRSVSELALPEAAVGAGFLRSAVWDRLHGYRECTPLADIDVLYFDRRNLGRDREIAAETILRVRAPNLPWQVRNQARMHFGNGDAPYRDLEDALGHWLETATAVAARLAPDGRLSFIAPYGLADLFAGQSRPTPAGRRRLEAYRARMAAKNWPGRWPGVRIEGLAD